MWSRPPARRVRPGGDQMSESFLPYGRQSIGDDDVAAVAAVLRSDWLTTGPQVPEFEREFAAAVGAREAVAVSSGTAALHASMHALGIGAGDEVIVPALTFAATANSVVYQGGTPIFADVDPQTLLIDPASVAARLTPRSRAIVGVDYGGQPCDYDALRELATAHGVRLVADACHAPGGSWNGRPVGTLADCSTFSLHPVKHVTSGEGGVVTTDDPGLAARMRIFRNHGITTDHRQREITGSWLYEMVELGYNYRLTDIQCALGRSQLARLAGWVERRRALARRYDAAFAGMPGLRPLAVDPRAGHAYHLYVIQLTGDLADIDRAGVFHRLRAAGIGANVHYLPVYLHPFYRERFGTGPGLCPRAEEAYERILSLPMFPAMADGDVDRVVREVERAVGAGVGA